MTGRANPQQYSYEPQGFTRLQTEVNEVKDVMKNNIEQILKRGENLEDLADKSSNLESTAIQFSVTAKKVKRKMWWQNTKMTLILIAVIVIILAAIGIGLAIKYAPSSKPTTQSPASTTASTRYF